MVVKGAPFTWRWVRAWCAAWWSSSREEECAPDLEDTPSDMGYATPVSVETPLQSSVSRCTSLNVIRDPFSAVHTPTRHGHAHAGRLAARSVSSDSVYTILIRLPPDSASCDSTADQPSIKMIADDGSGAAAAASGLGGAGAAGAPGAAGAGAGAAAATLTPLRGRAAAARADSGDYSLSLHPAGAPTAFPSPAAARRPSHMPDIRIPLNAKIIPKQLAPGSKALLANAGPKLQQHPKKKKKTQEKKADKKAAKTLSAILLTFIITWTPYNILVLLKPLTACTGCIPEELWDFFYYLCYINSTINPVCYALCNASFRRTYVRILTCKWHNRNRCAMNRGFYN
ncbi:muscarinic acetylcholine receptor DM1-like [Schistocerca nitens]|uniref:muscarinic acetylcholine receptor DM1-like n=1 Tax=Schistocerca nitens TaxID=7011 RepID=UPI0021195E38|nr:muscarinic acetylcholine receptor DM1-like [Schistocerca nitens]